MNKFSKEEGVYYSKWFKIGASSLFIQLGWLIPYLVSLFYIPIRMTGAETFKIGTTVIVGIPTTTVGIILMWKLKISKKEIVSILIAGLFVVAWEVFVEALFGWYLGLWYFMPGQENVFLVLLGGLRIGIDFYTTTLIIGTVGVYFIKRLPNNGRLLTINMIIFVIVLGWACDIFVGLMDTYFLTFIVWIILILGYVFFIIKVHNHLSILEKISIGLKMIKLLEKERLLN
ncbi:MAG: hypothetical protein GF364_18365 [Candidatus Lokiarchaeota archaeon]|nr:hypothetical protein [Candidatus Lokiarchaeota archaeon]